MSTADCSFQSKIETALSNLAWQLGSLSPLFQRDCLQLQLNKKIWLAKRYWSTWLGSSTRLASSRQSGQQKELRRYSRQLQPGGPTGSDKSFAAENELCYCKKIDRFIVYCDLTTYCLRFEGYKKPKMANIPCLVTSIAFSTYPISFFTTC